MPKIEDRGRDPLTGVHRFEVSVSDVETVEFRRGAFGVIIREMLRGVAEEWVKAHEEELLALLTPEFVASAAQSVLVEELRKTWGGEKKDA